MLRRLYDYFIAAADKPHAVWTMGLMSFAESSVFPIPPDVMLIPMALANPRRAWFYATVCMVTSVAGGLVGYAIGALLYNSVGQWLINLYGYADRVEGFRAAYAQYGAWIILLKGLTPIPYKIVTITSGFADYNVFLFTYFLDHCALDAVLHARVSVGPLWNAARDMIEKRLGLWVTLGAIVVFGGLIGSVYLF